MMTNIILLAIAYMLGSIPSAVWVGRKFYGVDVREHGSRNAGATNTLRVLGKKAAAIVFVMDMAKGFAAVMLSHLSSYPSGSDSFFILKIALIAAAVLGHIFPLFANFRGGKGVATLAGAAAGLYPAAVLICLVVFIVVFLITNYVSLSSMIAGLVFPISIYFIFGERSLPLIIFSCLVSVLLIVTHRKNIGRLLNGTESKINLFKK